MKPRSHYLRKKFTDDINYPYGFRKSGDFSIHESELLDANGSLCQALVDGEVSDPTLSDCQFLKVLTGETAAATEVEKVWLKYLRKTQQQDIVPSMVISAGKSMNTSYMTDMDADTSLM